MRICVKSGPSALSVRHNIQPEIYWQ